nr:uncharacterized protein LOC123759824 [Procambarus clarkii]
MAVPVIKVYMWRAQVREIRHSNIITQFLPATGGEQVWSVRLWSPHLAHRANERAVVVKTKEAMFEQMLVAMILAAASVPLTAPVPLPLAAALVPLAAAHATHPKPSFISTTAKLAFPDVNIPPAVYAHPSSDLPDFLHPTKEYLPPQVVQETSTPEVARPIPIVSIDVPCRCSDCFFSVQVNPCVCERDVDCGAPIPVRGSFLQG